MSEKQHVTESGLKTGTGYKTMMIIIFKGKKDKFENMTKEQETIETALAD